MQVTKIGNDYSNSYNQVAFKEIRINHIKDNPKLKQAIKDKNFLLLVAGPSGVGKDSVLNIMIDRFNKIVTHTTRAMRTGEVDGISYFFTTVEKFLEGIKNNEFVEYVNSFSGKYYGTKKETITKALDGKKPALAIVDVEGVKSIKDKLKDDSNVNVVSVFFEPPSLEILKSRLKGRGSETEKSLQERLSRAEYEMSRANEYDAVISFKTPEEGVEYLNELLHLK